jgi:hypothetical protein
VSTKKREPVVSSRAGIGGAPTIDDSEPLFKIAWLRQDQPNLPIDDAIRVVIGDPLANARNNSDFQRLQKKIKRNHPQWVAARERAARTPRAVPREHKPTISITSPQSLSELRREAPPVVEGDSLSAETIAFIKKFGRRHGD